jgi:hypothetical protein
LFRNLIKSSSNPSTAPGIRATAKFKRPNARLRGEKGNTGFDFLRLWPGFEITQESKQILFRRIAKLPAGLTR